MGETLKLIEKVVESPNLLRVAVGFLAGLIVGRELCDNNQNNRNNQNNPANNKRIKGKR